MKKLFSIIVFSTLWATSCSDFLTEIPKDEIAPSQFFQNPDHAFNAVNALYRSGLPSLFGGGVYSGSRIMLGAYSSGLIDNEYKGQEVHVQHAQQLTLNPVNMSSFLGGIWRDLYLGISRANNAIKYIPDTPGLSQKEADQLLAEAHFFRALNYFYLTRYFGDVPLVTAPYEGLDGLYVPRSPIADVYQLVVDDLQFATESDRLAESTMGSNENRITRGAAESLLADVYLTMSGFPLREDHYADAAASARMVIQSGLYTLTTHDENADGVWVPEASAYNKARLADNLPREHIYYFEYKIGISQSGYAQWAFPTTVSPELAYAIANNAYAPTNRLLGLYDESEDLRIQEGQYFHSSYTTADGTTLRFQTAPHLWFDETAAFETATSDKDLPVFTYSNVLLVAAESIAQSEGVTSEAVGYLSDVRARAHWKSDRQVIVNQLSGLSVEQFVEEVWKERLRELAFEFHIWSDIQRTRKMPVGDDGDIHFVDVVGYQNSFGGTYQEKHLLYPIPDDEMQRNPELEQNPGYSE